MFEGKERISHQHPHPERSRFPITSLKPLSVNRRRHVYRKATHLEVKDGTIHLLLVEAPQGVEVLLHGRAQDGKHGNAA